MNRDELQSKIASKQVERIEISFTMTTIYFTDGTELVITSDNPLDYELL